MYLVHYTRGAAYEPAEGGYYYEVAWADEVIKLHRKQAQAAFKELAEELCEEGYIVDGRYITWDSKYIGEGDFWVLEKTRHKKYEIKRHIYS